MGFGVHADFQVTIFPEKMQQAIDTPGGPASRQIKVTSEALLSAAIPRIGDEYSGTTGRPREPRRQRMAQSGKVVQGQGASWVVEFDHPAAAAHHNGARAHPIGARDQLLANSKFPNTRDGHPRYPNRLFGAYGPVDHPGTTANPFLLDAARQLGLRLSGALKRGQEGPFPLVRARTGFF